MTIRGNIVNIPARDIFEGELLVENGRIAAINKLRPAVHTGLPFIMPGFIDAHVHIESSMLVPSEFARLAVVHGTVATVSDPHEIANVCGMEGVDFMIANERSVNFKFNFGAPSCVPATAFETAGATITPAHIRTLLERPEIKYLSEMMNFPGVIFSEPEVLEKIRYAKEAGKPVDGHAPGLRGEPLKKYHGAGISTDHECFTEAEALEKLRLGMKILIREGSAARNFDALITLLHDYPDAIMFCSDDKHPDSLVESHIDELCRRAVAKGIDLFHVLTAACINPVAHYRLDVGQLREGDPADFIVVNDLRSFRVLRTFINGECVAEDGRTLIASQPVEPVNNFNCEPLKAAALRALPEKLLAGGQLPVIGAKDGQLITEKLTAVPKIVDGEIVADPASDVLKIVVVNRYQPSPPAIAFVKNFGIRHGAIASSVAHDSHNIIAVGADDNSLAGAINLVTGARGGISAVNGNSNKLLPLPVAGLMSAADGYEVAAAYTGLDALTKSMGATLSAPFMTLSFMALLVIPSLKLSDKGLFDGDRFRFV